MLNQIKFIECNDLEIIVSIEGQAVDKHPFYYPAIVLIYARKGKLILEVDKRTETVETGNSILINKYVHGFMRKSWTVEEGQANMYAFIFHQSFVEKVKKRFHQHAGSTTNGIEATYVLPPNPILTGLFESIASYIRNEQALDPHLVELKTMEAMMGILNFHPECHPLFFQEANQEKVDLQQLIENNYMYNLPLNKLAELSGRSLSTFSRDFKAIYKESPHRWIRKRRLLKAQELLLNTNRKPVEFYMELGFESLAHFSRAFKKEFGITLTEFRKSNHSELK